MEFPAGTLATGIARSDATLLPQRGWTEGAAFVEGENPLHIYGICHSLAARATRSCNHGAKDRAAVPFQTPSS